MTDSEVQRDTEASRGPSRGRRGADAGGPPPTQFLPSIDETEKQPHTMRPRYSPRGRSPLPHLVACALAVTMALWALDRARYQPGAPEPVRTSEWWVNLTGLLVPGQNLGRGAYSSGRMWLALALLLLAAFAAALWVGRLGRNLAARERPFGVWLAVAAFPAWWMLPLTLNSTGLIGRSRTDELIRFVIGLVVLGGTFVLLRWPALNRIWRSGHIPFDALALLLWVPNLIPWFVSYASSAYTLLVVSEGGDPGASAWRPTLGMYDWAQWTTRVSSAAVGALLVGVSVRQHLALRRAARLRPVS